MSGTGTTLSYTRFLADVGAGTVRAVTIGQGVQGFFVATPGLTAITGSQTATGTAPAAPSGNPYGY